MKLLEERIKKDGIVLPGNVLKVDSFQNHQIDPELSKAMGEEFARLFGDAGIDRVLTVEASGIAIEKAFQPGHQRLLDKGYRLESLASIASLDNGKVRFTAED